MHEDRTTSPAALWASFRFSVIGPLLAAPPTRGQLTRTLHELAEKTFTHPTTGEPSRFAARTLERWYYKALADRQDPARVLRRQVRKDAGRIEVPERLRTQLASQYTEHPCWSYQLHYDNLAALVRSDASFGPLPSYSTLRRYMLAQGLQRRAPRPKARPAEERALERRETREIRSFEMEHVGGLWHLDFHHGSRKILTHDGEWRRPIALGFLDDRSRLCCHLQWYLTETTEDLVHGLSQAIQKRGLPRAIQTDNGPAMIAEEFRRGLLSLGIVHDTTLPYSPYQNGKQEKFWRLLEGRLLSMLEGLEDLTLEFLNEVTQAWCEGEYNRREHSETKATPLSLYLNAKDVSRTSPSSEALRQAFRLEQRRTLRKSDGTISIEGTRFEIPSRFRKLRRLTVRYARWDLSRVHLVDEREDQLLAQIYPLDRHANADGRRGILEPRDRDVPEPEGDTESTVNSSGELPPRLKELLREYSATGLPPAYLPKPSGKKKEGDEIPKRQKHEGGESEGKR